ncbi:MAG: DUF2344 domain-containing protein [Clostridiaceae bacterium]|nr:DUF2344 domain-containing protein [Clostridiaceae bacterium]
MSQVKQNEYRYRIFYARSEIAAFTAHLDLLRLFQRTLKRADFPMAYTQGFNPRPIMEFALPIGVGIETRMEPFDVILTQMLEAQNIKNKLNQNLPNGIEIMKVELLTKDIKNVMSLVYAAEYEIEAENLGEAVETYYFDVSKPLIVSRERKGKTRTFIIREYIKDMQVLNQNRIKFISKAGSQANLRPDLFLKSLVNVEQISKYAALDAIIIRKKVYLKGD